MLTKILRYLLITNVFGPTPRRPLEPDVSDIQPRSAFHKQSNRVKVPRDCRLMKRS